MIRFLFNSSTLGRMLKRSLGMTRTQYNMNALHRIRITCISLLMLGASCVLVRQARPPATLVQEADMLTVFLTGNELGALKPCGCTSGQLGGLDRRSAILNSVPRKATLILDTGSLVESDSEQDLIKFNVMIRAFDLLDYDLVNLTDRDIEMVRNLGLLDEIGSVFNVISPRQPPAVKLPARFSKRFWLNGKTVSVTVATFDAESERMEQIGELFASQPNMQTVNILILNHCDPSVIGSVAKLLPAVDCLVCPADSDEPRLIGDTNSRPLVFSVGRFGRYICRLQVYHERSEGPGSQRTARSGENKLALRFSAEPVAEALPREPDLVELYKDYQQLVKEANLLEEYPRLPLDNGLEYVGSKSCKACHAYEYEKWSSKVHARAYATLEKVGSQYDPECVVCHVVVMKFESGFVSEHKTDHLKDVGCENCHGPGSEHIKSAGSAKTAGPKMRCLDCHTTEQSPDYAGDEQGYLEKIIHWREPNSADDVKRKRNVKDTI
jgi:hypothetical protein